MKRCLLFVALIYAIDMYSQTLVELFNGVIPQKADIGKARESVLKYQIDYAVFLFADAIK